MLSPRLFCAVDFGELTQVVIALAIRKFPEFIILPPDNDSPMLGFAKILPTDTRVYVTNPLAGFDVIRPKVSDICKHKGFTVLVLHGISNES